MSSLSFIIPAHNEAQMLGRTLVAISEVLRSLQEPAEIIVVDDASTDDTAAIAAAHGARVVSVQRRQIAAARNAGAQVASGDCFIFVDADTLVSESAVRSALAAMRAGYAGGGCVFRFDGYVPLYARLMLGIAVPLYRGLRLASGCFIFCRREAFQAAGGFDESLYAAEEAALSRALARQGPFVILPDEVTTSGRKLRTFSAREILGPLLRFMFKPWMLYSRQGLDIWYGERRLDPKG